MPYQPTVWVDDETPLSARNLNKIEQGIASSVPLGESNDEVALVRTLLLDVSTRQLHAVEHNDAGDPIAYELRDTDGTVIASATETYNDAGMPTQMVITVPRPDPEPDIIITITQVYDEDGTTFLRREQEVAYA